MPELNLPPQDDEIDLRELAAALVRRWRWLAGCTAAGLSLGGWAVAMQPQLQSVQLLVRLNLGPKLPSQVSFIKRDQEVGLISASLLPVQTSAEVQQDLQQLIPPERKGWQLAPLKVGKQTDDSQLTLTATVPKAELPVARAELEQLAKRYRSHQLRSVAGRQLLQPPLPGWISVNTLAVAPNTSMGRSLALGGLGGVVLGGAAALVADRRANRVYNAAQVLQLLGSPLLAKLPSLPWERSSAQAELAQLAQQLQPKLRWRVLSVAQAHPLVEPLVAALRQQLPQLQLEAAPPLLACSLLSPANGEPQGVLLVVECGFNSAQALQEARRVLEQLPGLAGVGVVLVGQLPPPELRG